MICGLSLSEWTGLITAAGIMATFGLSLYTWLRYARPRRRLEARLAAKVQSIAVTFVNVRGPDVVLEELGFECDDGSLRPRWAQGVSFSLTDKSTEHERQHRSLQLPRSVGAGDSLTFTYWLQNLKHDIEEEGHPFPVRAYCVDATGKVYRSPNLRWDVTCALSEHDPTLPGPTPRQ
jgi:hypothetical protein